MNFAATAAAVKMSRNVLEKFSFAIFWFSTWHSASCSTFVILCADIVISRKRRNALRFRFRFYASRCIKSWLFHSNGKWNRRNDENGENFVGGKVRFPSQSDFTEDLCLRSPQDWLTLWSWKRVQSCQTEPKFYFQWNGNVDPFLMRYTICAATIASWNFILARSPSTLHLDRLNDVYQQQAASSATTNPVSISLTTHTAISKRESKTRAEFSFLSPRSPSEYLNAVRVGWALDFRKKF